MSRDTLRTMSVNSSQRANALSQTLAASQPVRELAEYARAVFASGHSDEIVRKRVRARAEEIGLSSWRFLLPGLNRKVLRYPFPKFLIEAARYYAKGTRHKDIREFIESFTARIGLDDWVVDSAIHMARTGEPLPMVGNLFGGVHVQRFTFGSEPSEVVILAAGPFSDFEALADEFLATCSRVYPAESWQRSHTELRDARWLRAFYEDMTDAEIAWDELARLHPREIVHGNPAFADEHKRKVAQIKQARKRWMDKVTKILASASPDSGTD